MHTDSFPASRRIVSLAFAGFALIAGGCGKSPEEVKAAQTAELARTTGTLLVKSNLGQAAIVAKPAGGTSAAAYEGPANQPLANLPAGRYTITATREGWPEQRGETTVTAAQTVEVALNFASGSLRLDTIPAGASAKLGATVLGKTPLVVPQLPVGECRLTLEYPSWPAVTHKVVIAEGQETAASARLPHGKVSLDTHPSGATVRQGNATLGTTPLTFDPVPAGPRKYSLQLKGFPSIEVTLTVVDGQETKYRPALGAFFPALDPAELLRAVWIPDDPSKITTGFNATTGIYRPNNDIVKNIHRERLYNGWLRKSYRYPAVVKSYDAASGRLEFAEQKSELARYRVLAHLPPGTQPPMPIQKDVTLAVYGRLAAVEEPAWPGRVITLELTDAEFLPAESDSRGGAK